MASPVFHRRRNFVPACSPARGPEPENGALLAMTIDRSWLRLAAIFLVLGGGIFTACQFSPGWQLERAFNRLLDAAENRKWDQVQEMMAVDYRDGWGFTRAEALEGAQEAMRHFLVVEIQAEHRVTTRRGREAEISARLRLAGRGTAVAEAVLTRINDLTQDFRFAWKRESWKPWDWKLHAVSQPELDPSWTP